MKIELELHKDGKFLLLESQDIYNFVDEQTTADLQLACYVDKWCEYLNYPFLHNTDMKFGDTEYSRLEGWITGFGYAKGIDVDDRNGVVSFRYGKHTVTLNKPFKF